MNSTIELINNSAQSCRHCLAVVITKPSQQLINEADVGDTLPIAQIAGLTVSLAASDGCTFFKWAITEFERHENHAESVETLFASFKDDSDAIPKEIASIPYRYQNAHLTISAARSSSNKIGFLHDLWKYWLVTLSYDPEFDDPIERRAWPLQEVLFSRRVLKYGSYQMSWTCQGAEFYRNKDTQVNWFSRRDNRYSNLRKRFLDFQKGTSSYYNIWRGLVREYISRSLTEPKDRPLAISGIATAFGTGQNDIYLGGLSLGDLPTGLLWEVTSPTKSRPRDYQAPSWSWTSVHGTIECFLRINVDPELILISYKVISVQLFAQYGALDTEYIEILGHTKGAIWIDNRNTLMNVETGDAVGDEYLAYTVEDTDEGVSTGPIYIWWLQICPYGPGLDEGPSGLIMSTEDDQVFRRFGMFSFDPIIYRDQDSRFYEFHREQQQRWAEDCQLREIIII